MSFLTLHYTSHLLCHVDIQRHLYKTRLNPVLAIPPSSILLHTNESEKFPESKKGSGSSTPYRSVDFAGSVVSQVNTVGIIGGVKLVKWSSKDGESCVPFVLCSDPVLNKEVFSHERSFFPSLSCKSDCTQLDPTPIVKSLQSKGAFLENLGARCIVMPYNVLHSWHDEVSKGCSVPFLHMGEPDARELKEAKLKPPEAGSLLRIGVLATDANLKAGFYQEKLQNEGFEVVLPDKATMEHTDMEGASNLLRISLQVLLVRAVNSVIIASDDMQDLLPQDDPLLKKCIDPMDALVRTTIKCMQSTEKGT
ncbi:hypothetical protein RGQ29_020831 [Quercus rubra]|uniref:Uncharacterized protein n=1 Tax=Quercus rubra TaxID=3512 RepID=A0AAN7IXP6_QUERU|nr:hypothetical protein RGQ29_020831 [Quercus rubra]